MDYLHQNYLDQGFLTCVMKVLFILILWRTDIFVPCCVQWDKSINHGTWMLQQCHTVQKVSGPLLLLSVLLPSMTGNNQFANSHWSSKHTLSSTDLASLVAVLNNQNLVRWVLGTGIFNKSPGNTYAPRSLKSIAFR